MAGQRQPTDLIVMNGRKHLTKAEIEARKNAPAQTKHKQQDMEL